MPRATNDKNGHPMGLTRRQFGKLSAAALLAGPVALRAQVSLAANPAGVQLHGISAFGDLKYTADFPNFSYVNPQAPKGGTFNFSVPNWGFNQNPQTFDTLNSFVLKGNAPPRMELCFDALMIAPSDEASALYGMLAETVEISQDRNRYTFRLRPEAKWHDGTPVTSQDVAFSYDALKRDGHPSLSLSLRDLVGVTTSDPRTCTLEFNGKQSDRAILAAAVMPIFSKAWYTDNAFTETTMTPPLSSGAYRVKKAVAGRYIEYERVNDYWAKDLPFSVGRANFDVIRIEFYRERQAAFEAFKKGDVTYRQEFTSKTWATEYDFPAMQDGRVKKQLFPSEKVPSFQGWAINKRRKKFADKRTVQAIALCFDFEWTNKNFFFDAYARTQSFFSGSDFEAKGKPSKEELVHLEPLRDQIDASVFGEALLQPVSDGSGRDRKLLRQANSLLREAGWKRNGNRLVDADGDVFTLEFLIRSPTFERILGKFVSNLQALGIDASIRLVDPAQYTRRLETYDFDVTGLARNYGATPTRELIEQYFGSATALVEGNTNYAGLQNPAVDALIAKISDVESRAQLVPLLQALDRVLRSTHSWIPNWTSANHRVAFWDMFGFPETKPDYTFPVETFWWFDVEKAKAIGKA
ncbi:MAG: extracellular solute-binding protein [Pseudomonadota bacterium]